MDLSGLPETAVDSEDDDDEEDIERASDPLMSRDIVRDCLEKDPIDRTDDDIGEYLRSGPFKRVDILRGTCWYNVVQVWKSFPSLASPNSLSISSGYQSFSLVFKKQKQKNLLERVLLSQYLQIVL